MKNVKPHLGERDAAEFAFWFGAKSEMCQFIVGILTVSILVFWGKLWYDTFQ